QGHFAYRFGKDPDAGEKIIEAWIRSNFTDSEDAEEHAGNRILVEFEADIVAHLNDHSERLKQEIEELLDIYAAAQDDLKLGGCQCQPRTGTGPTGGAFCRTAG
ncbi:MAG: hypothetical protein ACKO4W_03885, partial [Bacteroidota bacterium]